jgi:hypothetical protein
MADRKATFAKRQRETELKDKAREKEARRQARRTTPRVSKGPEIAWDEAVRYTESPLTGDLAPSVDPGDEEVIPDGPTRRGDDGAPVPRPVAARSANGNGTIPSGPSAVPPGAPNPSAAPASPAKPRT